MVFNGTVIVFFITNWSLQNFDFPCSHGLSPAVLTCFKLQAEIPVLRVRLNTEARTKVCICIVWPGVNPLNYMKVIFLVLPVELYHLL